MPTVSQHYNLTTGDVSAFASDDSMRVAAPVVLMVSGGADSTALLLMACSSRLDIADGRGCVPIARERLHVLHVNHHLRGEASDGDEMFVRDLCERFGLPLCVEHASFECLEGQNLEAAAREVRYAAAKRYVRELCREVGVPRSAARILTAHTASDRAETFFMNAIKGSGPAGLSSIPRRRNIVVRPLIDKTHDELCDYLRCANQPWREDESNNDTSYLRNFVRHNVMPLALERNGNIASTIGSTCDILGDEDAFLSQLASTALRSCIRRQQEGLVVLDGDRLAAAEVAIARRMIRLAIRMIDSEARLEMRHVEAVLSCVAARSGSRTLPGGIDARMEFGTLALRTAAAREAAPVGWLSVPGAMACGNGCVLEASVVELPAVIDFDATIRAAAHDFNGFPVLLADAEALGYGPADTASLAEKRGAVSSTRVKVWVDSAVAGDVMCPLGMHGRSKKVSDILNEAKIPVSERAAVPVVRTGPACSIVWVAGVRADDRFKCTAATRYAVKIVLKRME